MSWATRPSRKCDAIDHGNDPVHRDAALDVGPVERLDQRLRQRETRGLDQDMVDLRLARQDEVERPERNQSATVQQMQPLASSTTFSSGQASMPQSLEDVAIDADIRRTR